MSSTCDLDRKSDSWLFMVLSVSHFFARSCARLLSRKTTNKQFVASVLTSQ